MRKPTFSRTVEFRLSQRSSQASVQSFFTNLMISKLTISRNQKHTNEHGFFLARPRLLLLSFGPFGIILKCTRSISFLVLWFTLKNKISTSKISASVLVIWSSTYTHAIYRIFHHLQLWGASPASKLRLHSKSINWVKILHFQDLVTGTWP